MTFDAVVVGAGAAGMMCAIEAARGGKRVAVLEHNQEPGRKILISGGGRCNFTNLYCTADNFISKNPHFAKSALARYPPQDFVDFIVRHRIAYHEKKWGQLFCDNSARQVVDALVADCRSTGVKLILGCRVQQISGAGPFVIETSAGALVAPALVIATGGLSIPKIGATGFGYDVARQYGHRIIECRPALVPLLLHGMDKSKFCDLAGVATEVIATAKGKQYRERMLVTHRGLSGPAILQISSHWKAGQEIRIDLLPGEEVPLDNDPAMVRDFLLQRIPKRLLTRWLEVQGLGFKQLDSRLAEALHQWTIQPAGTEGFEKAEVTAGGADTVEISSKSMESKLVKGLYWIGEVVDVTGELGGFNFQWAWASGFAAGNAIASS